MKLLRSFILILIAGVLSPTSSAVAAYQGCPNVWPSPAFPWDGKVGKSGLPLDLEDVKGFTVVINKVSEEWSTNQKDWIEVAGDEVNYHFSPHFREVLEALFTKLRLRIVILSSVDTYTSFQRWILQ